MTQDSQDSEDITQWKRKEIKAHRRKVRAHSLRPPPR
jgi:hypothetical protein